MGPGTWTTLLRRSCSVSQFTRDAEAFSAASMWRRRGRRPSQSASEEASASPRTCCLSTTRQFATRASTTHRVSKRPSKWLRRLWSNHAVLTAAGRASAPRLTSLPVVSQGRLVAAAPDQHTDVFVTPLCSGLYRYIPEVASDGSAAVLEALLRFPGHVQTCPDRVHMRPV